MIMGTSQHLQLFAIIFMMIGAVFTLIVGFKTEQLIPNYNYKINNLYYGMIDPITDNLKKLVSHLLDEIENSQFSNIQINPELHAKLKNLESALTTSKSKKMNLIGDIFDESPQKAKNRGYYLLSFSSIGVAIFLQALVLLIDMQKI